jgi:uncharacterized protein YbaR (Trm112 family)
MPEIRQERINYAVAESAALGEPVAVEKEPIKVIACPHCKGTGLVPSEEPLTRLDVDDRGEAYDWHMAPLRVGVTACRPCASTGHSEIRCR